MTFPSKRYVPSLEPCAMAYTDSCNRTKSPRSSCSASTSSTASRTAAPKPLKPYPRSRTAPKPPMAIPQTSRITSDRPTTTSRRCPSSRMLHLPRRRPRRARSEMRTMMRLSRRDYRRRRTRVWAGRHEAETRSGKRQLPKRRPRRRAQLESRTTMTVTSHQVAGQRRRVRVGKEASMFVSLLHLPYFTSSED
jgi:hypothetical protein